MTSTLTERDAKEQAARDLRSVLLATNAHPPPYLLTADADELWRRLRQVISWQESTDSDVIERREAYFHKMVDAGVVGKLVDILHKFAHLTFEGPYIDPKSSNEVPEKTWYFALFNLSELTGCWRSDYSIASLSEWKKHGVQMIQAYRASKLFKPIEGEVEHNLLSRYRNLALDTLYNLMLQPFERRKPDREDVRILLAAIPFLVELRTTFLRSPRLEETRRVALSSALFLHKAMQGLIIHHSKSSPVSIAVLGESTFSDIFRHCILAADDSPDNVASRVEQMDVIYVTCNAYSQPSVELLDAIVEHKVVAVMTKLMRDIKEDTQRYPAAGPGTEQLWKKWFGRMVTFWLDIMDRGTALRRGEVAEQTVDANLLYLLEWWTVESPHKLFRELDLGLMKCITAMVYSRSQEYKSRLLHQCRSIANRVGYSAAPERAREWKRLADTHERLGVAKVNVPLEKDQTCRRPMCDYPDLAEMRCARCKEVYYCTRECQKLDWKSHKAKCKEKK